MKLYFHIGIEKTGSSHLQSLSGINLNLLQQNRIWFPLEGKHDKLLLQGEISAGNAQSLTDAIHANDFKFCESFIAQRIQDANDKSCHSLFLSNELLLIALAKAEKLNQFMNMLKNMGFSDVSFLLFLRDPVDQALSLYKHRAKNGKALDIEKWPMENYLYGEALMSFLTQAQSQKINLKVRQFTKKKGALENILFKEWLNVQGDLKPPPKTVNPSLSLSELMLLKKVRQHQPHLVSVLYEKLIRINKKNKCESSRIEFYHEVSLSNQLAKYKDTWEICNKYLPENEKIRAPKENLNHLTLGDKISSFSDDQMEVVASIISDSLSFKLKLQLLKLKLKAKLFQLLRALKLKY